MTDSMGGPAVPTSGARTALRPLGHNDVELDAGAWLGEWQARNRIATIPHVLDRVESGEAHSNLARLVGESDADFIGMVFTDSDVYKCLEAVAWAAPSLAPDDPLLSRAQRLVELLERVQCEDGYLNSRVQGSADVERFADPQWGHELYCAGHLFQAAVAATRTGSLPQLATIAGRFADFLVSRLGPDVVYVEGHPEVETALVELYRTTGQASYLELARRQVHLRGQRWLGEDRFGAQYFQDHVPVRDGAPATGHAVRQLYLLTGAVDVAVETDDEPLLQAVISTWTDLFDTKTYVSGAHGSRHRDEAIGDPFELPPDRAYAETCAAIASFQLNWRLLLATGQARFADEMETVLYNAVAVSTSTDGAAFFYSNPLQIRTGHDGSHEDAPAVRLPWYTCACCPPNVARLLASVHDYTVSSSDAGVQVHLYAAGQARVPVPGGDAVLTIATAYPYDDQIELRVDTTVGGAWDLALRIPAWCTAPTLSVDGVVISVDVTTGYAVVRRDWNGHHQVRLKLPMAPRLVAAHPRVDAVRGCVALMHGPVLYAIEQVDVPDGVVLDDLRLAGVAGQSPDTSLARTRTAPMLIELDMLAADAAGAALYATAGPPASGTPIRVRAIPYHLWGNRRSGAMRVWLPLQ